MSKVIYIIGGGGHARVVAKAALEKGLRPVFIVSRSNDLTTKEECVGEDDFISNPPNGYDWGLICGIGSTGSMMERALILERYNRFSANFVSVASPRALVDSSAVIGPGVFVAPGAIIANDAHIDAHSLINTGAIVEHDCVIGSNCHVASGATVLGGVRIGRNVFVGAGSALKQGITVEDGGIIGAGSFCNRSITNPGETWVGLPARRIAGSDSRVGEDSE